MAKRFFLSSARKKQLLIALFCLSSIVLLAAVAAHYVDVNKSMSPIAHKKIALKTTDFSRPDSLISDKALWRDKEGARLSDLENKQKELEKKLKLNAKPQSDNPFALGNLPPPVPPEMNANATKGRMPNSSPVEEKPHSMITSVDIHQSPSASAAGTQTGTKTSIGNNNIIVPRSANVQKTTQSVNLKGIRPNMVITEDNGDLSRIASVKSFRAHDSYIPSGTFLRAELLGGVDAPTGGEAQNASPHPVLMRVSNMAQLPNKFKYNFKGCMVIGTAYGDISAERAYIRTERLSCVGSDGRAIDMPIKGYVAGEDGKTGVRGTVVTKQGQVLANALFSATLSGFGQGVSNAYNVTSTSAFGTSSAVSAGDQYKAGLASGFGSSMDRLAQYYIKLADKLFPVVEINAGRKVDIVLLEGFQIDPSNSKGQK